MIFAPRTHGARSSEWVCVLASKFFFPKKNATTPETQDFPRMLRKKSKVFEKEVIDWVLNQRAIWRKYRTAWIFIKDRNTSYTRVLNTSTVVVIWYYYCVVVILLRLYHGYERAGCRTYYTHSYKYTNLLFLCAREELLARTVSVHGVVVVCLRRTIASQQVDSYCHA